MTVYKTGDVDGAERFSYWREAVCDSYVHLDCETEKPRAFSGEIKLWRFQNLSTSVVSGSQQVVRRRKRDIGRSDEASFLISLQLEKNGLVEQAGRCALLNKGDFALYSSIDPYKLTIPEDFRQLVIQIPRYELLRRLPAADMLTGMRVSRASDSGSFASDNLVRFVKEIANSGEVVRQYMKETIVDLVAMGLASVAEETVYLSNSDQRTILRANTFIQSNLANPDLDRSMLAENVGLSVRRLNQIYQSSGSSISVAIRNARLDRIAADLLDRRFASQSITEIAFRWGINNVQYFSQIFKKRYGMSPRDYRQNSPTVLLN
ncbi:helix-turn-helix domain-containing protein [Nitratireductor sp. XY-223]|uniref:AraC-like ligand-binding domain-containing protein n=1 Tax=Nitratireductor sp. XY-223 TaxID=2561926 RepID=UPI00145A5B6E|nr:helix-turn-helix domain-containing protein [Nitratireductor sp. XY-223]